MKQKNDFRPIQKRASELGVFIIALDLQAMIVLADTGNKDFVTWRYWIDEHEDCHFEHGHYFGYTFTPKDDQLNEAREDYQHRINQELEQACLGVSS
tara:strand:+ start:129 stop:419 length:291 start_codon:yes stop_codon:yes gene_type:complete